MNTMKGILLYPLNVWQSHQFKRRALIAAGICVACEEAPAPDADPFCGPCYAKEMAAP